MSNVSELENLVERLSQDRNIPSRLTNATAELLVGGVVALKARIAELEAERDKMTALFNARCREAKLEVAESRAIAFEECARALTGQGGGLFSGRALADRIRALTNTPPAMVVVERTMLAGLGEVLKESLATTHNHRCTTGTPTSCGYYRCNEIRAALAIITKALETPNV